MNKGSKSIIMMYAEDDPEDRMLLKDAWEESDLSNELHFVEDGEALMDYLFRRGKYAELSGQPLPGLILLDLNMPKKDGREALGEIKSDPNLRRIPIVVLTTSREEEDIIRSYDMGVSGFIIKPVTFESLCEMIKGVSKYWFEIVELPPQGTGG
jgi:CheY-like chemotaxis protein